MLFHKADVASSAGTAARSAADGTIGKEEESRTHVATQRGSVALSQTTARSRDSFVGRKTKVENFCRTERRGKNAEFHDADDRTAEKMTMTQWHFQGHYVRFAQRIDRRIRDLRETLLAVIPQWPRQCRKECRRRVVSHAPVSFLAV